MSRDEVEDLLYNGFQGRYLERGVLRRGLWNRPQGRFAVGMRSIAIAQAMRRTQDGRGDVCCPGPMSPGPALAFGATPLEFLRHLLHKGTSPASARAGGLSWTDPRRGLVGWDGARGMMTQVLAGVALAFANRREDRVALVFERRSAVETGGWHEGLNFAAARRAPVIVVLVEGNRDSDRKGPTVEAVARSYGIAGVATGDGPLVDTFATATAARRRATEGGGPTLMALERNRDPGSWGLHEAFVEWASTRGGLSEHEVRAVERAAAAGVDHALSRIADEPPPDSQDALAAVRTGSPPLRPWTRLKTPKPGGTGGAASSGAPNVQ